MLSQVAWRYSRPIAAELMRIMIDKTTVKLLIRISLSSRGTKHLIYQASASLGYSYCNIDAIMPSAREKLRSSHLNKALRFMPGMSFCGRLLVLGDVSSRKI